MHADSHCIKVFMGPFDCYLLDTVTFRSYWLV